MNREATEIVRHLLRTEKSALGASQRKYLFLVSPRATKPQIKQAVEDLFKVKVLKVHTSITPGKPRRVRAVWGWRPDQKRAWVTLAQGSKIEVAS